MILTYVYSDIPFMLNIPPLVIRKPTTQLIRRNTSILFEYSFSWQKINQVEQYAPSVLDPASTCGTSGCGRTWSFFVSSSASFASTIAFAIVSSPPYFTLIWGNVNQILDPVLRLDFFSVKRWYREDFFHSPLQLIHSCIKT